MTDPTDAGSTSGRRIRCLACDVDGTLTDGGVHYSSDGTEARRFHIRDGLGIVAARRIGLVVVWISGRDSAVVRRRAEELGVDLLLQGVRDKAAALRTIAERFAVDAQEIAFIGDDLNDLPAFAVAGLTLSPADAAGDVRDAADIVLQSRGGDGAVREAIERILGLQGDWARARDAYLAWLSAPSNDLDRRSPGQ